jgi:hypothetical protein
MYLVAVSSAGAVSPQFYGLMWNGQFGSLESASDWDAVAHSGAKVIRIQGFWKQVANNGNWEKDPAWENSFDKYFSMAAERNITILPYLYGRGTSSEEARFYRGSELGGWLKFVWTFVQRYGRGGTFWMAHPALPYEPVTVWEVWNEPNLKTNNPLLWDAESKKWIEKVQPRNYAEFFSATSNTITEAQGAIRKAGEPLDTKILTGGLYQEAGSSLMSVWQFFEEISKDTALNIEFKSRNSGLGLHPYSFAGNEASKIAGFKEDVNAGRTALTHFDSFAKPLWITEMGWAVPGEGLGSSEPSSEEMEQASLLTSSFNWLKAESVSQNIEYAAWYNYSNFNDPRWSYHCGLRNWYGVYRPSWWAYQEQTGAARWPSPTWHIDNLGGGITADPDISSWGPGRLDVFARGAGNALYHKSYASATGWSIWENLGGILTSGPGAVSWGTNRIDVVARATDNTVSHWAWDGSSWHIDNLGGNVTSDPDISSSGPGNLDIFSRDTANSLVHKTYSALGGWSGWSGLGGMQASGPGAVSWSSSRTDVVTRAPDNSVSHWAWAE